MLCFTLPQEPEGGSQLFIMRKRLAQEQALLRKTRSLLQAAGPGGGGSGGMGSGAHRDRGGAASAAPSAPRPAHRTSELVSHAVNPHSRISKRRRMWETEAALEGFEE